MARLALLVLGFQVACSSGGTTDTPSTFPDAFDDEAPLDVEQPDLKPVPDQEHEPGPCDDLGEGAPCDDANACTTGDSCQAGFCVPGAPVVCDASADTACTKTTCDPAKGCVQTVAPDGGTCSVACFTEAQCLAGACLPLSGTEIAWESDDPCIDSYGCDPLTGGKVPYFKLACPEGTACKGGDDGVLKCLAVFTSLCRPCHANADCAESNFPADVALCVSAGDDGSYCGGDCSVRPCPTGYDCVAVPWADGSDALQCRPSAGATCPCNPAWAPLELSTDCSITNDFGICTGTRTCTTVGLTACDAFTPMPEKCDGKDNDCNGEVDDTPDKGCGVPGACCLEPGVCKKLFDQSCSATGGKYQGTGVPCANAACGGPATGACCLSGGVCEDVPVADCIAGGGDYKGDGFQCANTNCLIPVPKGACCYFDGSCDKQSGVKCNLAGGAYSGDGTSCAGAPCPAKGACCLPNTTCVETSEPACLGQKGLWSITLSCAQSQCTPPAGSGACCLGEGGACDVLPQAQCSTAGAKFLAGETCQGQCDPPEAMGACCFPDTTCGFVAKSQCSAPNMWKGAKSVCTETLCIPPGKGACCIAGSCLPGLVATECADFSGAWKEGASCDKCPK